MKRLLPAILLLALSAGVPACDEDSEDPGTPEAGCVASGGQVGTGQCCLATQDFPNTCAIGACGCSPENSHAVQVCVCPDGRCFDGTRCVTVK